MGLHRARAARRRRVGRLRRAGHPRGDRHAARRVPRLPGAGQPRGDDDGRGDRRRGRGLHRLRDRPPVRRAPQAQPPGPPGRRAAVGQGRGLPARQGRPGGIPGPLHRGPAGPGPGPGRHVADAVPDVPALEPGRRGDLGTRVCAARLPGRQLLPEGRTDRRAGQPAAGAGHRGGRRVGGGCPLGRPPPRPSPGTGRPAARPPLGGAAAGPLPAPAHLPRPPATARWGARAVADRQRGSPGRGRLGVRRAVAGRARPRRARAGSTSQSPCSLCATGSPGSPE